MAAALAGASLLACGGQSIASPGDATAPASSSDAGPSRSGPADGGGSEGPQPSQSDASASDSSQGATLPTEAGSAACNGLADVAPPIVAHAEIGPMPSGEGGTIADGLYFATEARLYAGASGAGPRSSMRITGNAMELRTTDSLVDIVLNATYVTNGPAISVTITCPSVPDPGPSPIDSYSASPTTLTLFETAKNRVLVFTKQ